MVREHEEPHPQLGKSPIHNGENPPYTMGKIPHTQWGKSPIHNEENPPHTQWGVAFVILLKPVLMFVFIFSCFFNTGSIELCFFNTGSIQFPILAVSSIQYSILAVSSIQYSILALFRFQYWVRRHTNQFQAHHQQPQFQVSSPSPNPPLLSIPVRQKVRLQRYQGRS